jgi:predicted RNA binding protein YcfA (HicA-like mRNA interferase family)
LARKYRAPRLPLISSNQLIAALRRLGFVDGPTKSGSHFSMYRPKPEGTGRDVISVVLNQREIPRGTLDSVLKAGRISREELLRALARKR